MDTTSTSTPTPTSSTLPSFSALLGSAWHALIVHWKLFMTVSVAMALVQLLSGYVLPESWVDPNLEPQFDFTPSMVIVGILALIINVILQAVLYYSVVFRNDAGLTFSRALSGGLSVSLKVLATEILKALLTLIGLVLLIVPGFIVLAWLTFAEYALIKENLGVIDSLKRSKELTRGFVAPILGRLFLLILLIGIPTMLLSVIPNGTLLVTVIASPLSSLYVVHLYEARLAATTSQQSSIHEPDSR